MLRLPSYTVQWFRIVILEMKLIYLREKIPANKSITDYFPWFSGYVGNM